jgi:hypothetical protein
MASVSRREANATLDQQPENQLAELRRYVASRAWTPAEYVALGASPAPRTVDPRSMACWPTPGDRLERKLRHLVTFLDELQALGIAFVSLGEGIDCTTPAPRSGRAGRVRAQTHPGMVKAGLARARRHGTRLGRPEKRGFQSPGWD